MLGRWQLSSRSSVSLLSASSRGGAPVQPAASHLPGAAAGGGGGGAAGPAQPQASGIALLIHHARDAMLGACTQQLGPGERGRLQALERKTGTTCSGSAGAASGQSYNNRGRALCAAEGLGKRMHAAVLVPPPAPPPASLPPAALHSRADSRARSKPTLKAHSQSVRV